MKFNFFKYQGTGNDFIILNDRDRELPINQSLINELCNRRFGIGADGLMLLQNEEGYDFRMKYFNADGRESSMCCNGGRCLVQFAKKQGIISDKAVFIAIDGPHEAFAEGNNVQLKMKDVLEIGKLNGQYFVDTGSPHVVIFFVNEILENYPVYQEGKALRESPFWVNRGGMNVNFVQRKYDGTLNLRTYERGIEDETLSCGTGAVATALVANQHFSVSSPLYINTQGGKLRIDFTTNQNGYHNIYLTGEAKLVYSGFIETAIKNN